MKARGAAASISVDGWFVPEDLSITFAKGKQNDVDILVGSNRDEGTFFQRGGAVTVEQFESRAKQRYANQRRRQSRAGRLELERFPDVGDHSPRYHCPGRHLVVHDSEQAA